MSGSLAPSPLVVVAGPTAAGKSAAALAVAVELGAEIVSCDSVAVYRGFNVGAAKPTPDQRARVRHHLVDVAEPDEPFTAARYATLADAAIADCHRRGVPVVVVGGTLLYLDALLRGLFEAPAPDRAIRARLRGEAAGIGWPALHARLAVVDPPAAARIHRNDGVRIERALEVFEQTGVPISRHHDAQPRGGPRHPARVFVLDPAAPVLEAAIGRRVDAMIAGGLVEETAALVRRCGRGLKALGALGYKEALSHLDGMLDPAQLPDAIRRATRRFARRQRSWLRKAWPPPGSPEVPVRWLPGAESLRAQVFEDMIRQPGGPLRDD